MAVRPLHSPLPRTENFVAVLVCPCLTEQADWDAPGETWWCHHGVPKISPAGPTPASKQSTRDTHHGDRSLFWRARLCGEIRLGWVIMLEQWHMECWMNTLTDRELKDVTDRINLAGYGKGTNASRTSLSRPKLHLEISVGEPCLFASGWYCGVSFCRASTLILYLRIALCRWWCAESQTLSWNQWLIEGTSDGAPDQENRGCWHLSMHWKGVYLVADWRRGIWAYSAQHRDWFQVSWGSLRYVGRDLPI